MRNLLTKLILYLKKNVYDKDFVRSTITSSIRMMLISFFNYIRACMHDITIGAGRYTVFLMLLHLPVWCGAQVKLDYYVSNAGNDSFPGTSIALAKKTISAMAPALQKTAYSNGIVKQIGRAHV